MNEIASKESRSHFTTLLRIIKTPVYDLIL